MKEFIVTNSSVMEIQNLAVNPKSEPVKSNSKQYQSMLPAKINDKIFKINKNNLIFWSF